MEKTVLLACGHTITLAGSLKMKDFRRLGEAEKAGDLTESYTYLAQLIKAWDWPGLDPRDPASYDELEIGEYRQVLEAISEYLLAEATGKN